MKAAPHTSAHLNSRTPPPRNHSGGALVNQNRHTPAEYVIVWPEPGLPPTIVVSGNIGSGLSAAIAPTTNEEAHRCGKRQKTAPVKRASVVGHRATIGGGQGP